MEIYGKNRHYVHKHQSVLISARTYVMMIAWILCSSHVNNVKNVEALYIPLQSSNLRYIRPQMGRFDTSFDSYHSYLSSSHKRQPYHLSMAALPLNDDMNENKDKNKEMDALPPLSFDFDDSDDDYDDLKDYESPFSTPYSDADEDDIVGIWKASLSDDDEEEDNFGKGKSIFDGKDNERDIKNNEYDDDDDDFDDTVLKTPEKDSTLQRIEEQQRQIDLLMQLVQQQNENKQSSKASPKDVGLDSTIDSSRERAIPNPSSTTNKPSGFSSTSSTTEDIGMNMNMGVVAPLKAMMFIDGTWLYYSIHERKGRKCPISTKFGRGWQHYYQVDW